MLALRRKKDERVVERKSGKKEVPSPVLIDTHAHIRVRSKTIVSFSYTGIFVCVLFLSDDESNHLCTIFLSRSSPSTFFENYLCSLQLPNYRKKKKKNKSINFFVRNVSFNDIPITPE